MKLASILKVNISNTFFKYGWSFYVYWTILWYFTWCLYKNWILVTRNLWTPVYINP